MERNRKPNEISKPSASNNNHSGSNSSNQQNNKQTRFSIFDAFEEENDEAIRVYGSTVISGPIRKTDDVAIRIQNTKYVPPSTRQDATPIKPKWFSTIRFHCLFVGFIQNDQFSFADSLLLLQGQQQT